MVFSYQQPLLLRCNLARFKPGSLLRLEAPFLRRFPLFVHSIVTGTLGSSYCGLRITAQPFTHPPLKPVLSSLSFPLFDGACILRVHPPPPGFVIPFHFCVCLFLLTTGCIATPSVCVLQSLGIAFILNPLCVTSRTVHRSRRIEIKKLYTTQFNCMEGGLLQTLMYEY